MQASQTQQRISAELTATQAAVGQASRQAAAWAALIDGTDKALRDLGDCQTYFEVIEADLKELADCLEQTAAQQPQQLEAATAAAALTQQGYSVVLQGPASQHRGVRRHLAQFTRDVLAVLVGLRAAVMLDYMVIPPELTLSVIQRLNMTCAGSNLCAAQLNGCQYVYSASMLAERAAALSGGSQSCGGTHQALFIRLKGGLVAVCPPEELQTAQAQLSRLCSVLGTHGHQPEAGERAAGWPPEVVDLNQCTGLPIMPTLSGWLLEYAGVYLASAEDAAALAAALSQQTLQLCSVDCQLKGAQATNKTEGQQQGQSCLLDLLVTLEVQTLDVLA
eukprot:jgi/Astpho2/2117/fgenesh1_pg.00038_%23_172_t